MPRKILFLLLFPLGIFAQDRIELLLTKGDSLVKKNQRQQAVQVYQEALVLAKQPGNDERLLSVFKKIGVGEYGQKHYIEAERYFQEGLRIDSTSKTAADIFYNLSLVKRKRNQLDSVLPYLEKSMAIYSRSEQDAATYNAYLSAGIIYKNRQLFDVALEYLLKAEEGFTKLKDQKKLASVANTIGNVQNRLRNFENALKSYSRALKMAAEVKDTLRMGLYSLGKGSAYRNLGRLDSAMLSYKKALNSLPQKEKEYGIAQQNIAEMLKEKRAFREAERYYLQSIELKNRLNETSSLLYSYNGLTDLYLEQGRTENAKDYLNLSINLIPKVKDNFILLDYYRNRVRYHEANLDFKRAYSFQNLYSELFEQIYDIQKTDLVQLMQTRYEYQKKANENLQLSLANQNNLLLIEKQKNDLQRKNGFLVLLFLLLAGLGIGYYLFRQRQKVQYQYDRIEKLEAIYRGQETIKKRIARDLHDIITTNFDGLRLKILSLVRADNIEELSTGIAQDLSNINQQIRQVSHRLSPLEMHVKERPFSEIIKSQLTEFQLYRKIFVTLENSLPEVLNELGFEAQNHLYSILLEALNNIAKHAKATEVEVSFGLDKKENVHVTITDNGIGIDDTDTPGIGLMNIRQRAELLGGKSTIEKVSGGTRVQIDFPLKT